MTTFDLNPFAIIKPNSISIVEDDASIRESLTLFIGAKTQLELLSESESVEIFLKVSFDESPQILLLDVGLPGMTGIEGIPLIKEKYPEIDIVMLTTYEEDDMIFKALCAGATSYISKRTPLIKIMEGLQIVANGGSYMSPSIAKKVIRFFNKAPIKKSTLTTRQQEIVKHIVDGLTYTKIAETCFISINTVRTHIKKIYAQLEIHGKTELVQKFMNGEI